jgi:hypothetical protein
MNKQYKRESMSIATVEEIAVCVSTGGARCFKQVGTFKVHEGKPKLTWGEVSQNVMDHIASELLSNKVTGEIEGLIWFAD